MALPATDDFQGTDGDALTTYSSNWTLNTGDFKIQESGGAGRVTPDEPANEAGAHWNADSFNNDQYAELTLIASVGPAVFIGPAVRCAASGGTYYGFYVSTAEKYLFKMVSGSFTTLASSSSNIPGANDVLRIEASGTTITPKVNGTTDSDLGAQTDSAISSGSAGICGYGSSSGTRGDDFEGGNVAAGGISVPVAYHQLKQQGIA